MTLTKTLHRQVFVALAAAGVAVLALGSASGARDDREAATLTEQGRSVYRLDDSHGGAPWGAPHRR